MQEIHLIVKRALIPPSGACAVVVAREETRAGGRVRTVNGDRPCPFKARLIPAIT